MSKYDALWTYIQELDKEKLVLRFADIARIAGTPLDHSFLKYKKGLTQYGYAVGKISRKSQTVLFIKEESDQL